MRKRRPQSPPMPSHLSLNARAFIAYHRANPEVYAELRDLARKARAAGHRTYSIATLFEVVRWERSLRAASSDGFKLNNNHRAYYARLIMRHERPLRAFFRVREQYRDEWALVLAELLRGEL